ncbi:MAG TPA: dihydrofolate reductase [Oscillatoriaceae cyanobacterium M33_DOE_052]|uniref:Dihydrofolate reductase n=1 Tax=Planktothricoides sp. SpSt-374 TaxID=2282167 RepID=A0A7C3VJ14_9CYAN|nr:dihydrofolate reductase [Oscillatoriaceae cyanobacterium M33_DOE_052]
MKKVCLFIAASLDGYIARKNGDIDWLFTDQDYGTSDFMAGIDTVVMGRKTYEQVLGFGEYPYQGKAGFVVSQTRAGETDDNVEFIGGDLKEFINQLRHQPGQDIWLVGGGEIIYHFLRWGLVDELILSVHPIILGDGIPLIYRDSELATVLELKNIITYDSGLVQMYYSIVSKG